MVGGAEATGAPNDTAVVYTPAFHAYDDKGQQQVYVWNMTFSLEPLLTLISVSKPPPSPRLAMTQAVCFLYGTRKVQFCLLNWLCEQKRPETSSLLAFREGKLNGAIPGFHLFSAASLLSGPCTKSASSICCKCFVFCDFKSDLNICAQDAHSHCRCNKQKKYHAYIGQHWQPANLLLLHFTHICAAKKSLTCAVDAVVQPWLHSRAEQSRADFNSSHVDQYYVSYFPFPIWRDESMHDLIVNVAKCAADAVAHSGRSIRMGQHVMIRVDIALTHQGPLVRPFVLHLCVHPHVQI